MKFTLLTATARSIWGPLFRTQGKPAQALMKGLKPVGCGNVRGGWRSILSLGAVPGLK